MRRWIRIFSVALSWSVSLPLCADLEAVFSRLVASSPLEPPGSRGALGYVVGASTTRAAFPGLDPLSRRMVLGGAADGETDALWVPRIHLVKGSSRALDAGIAGGYEPVARTAHIGAHLQWTPWESLRWPAMSVRLRHEAMNGSRVWGVAQGAELLVGYGFWRILRAYGAWSVMEHRAHAALPKEDRIAWGLVETTLPTVRRKWLLQRATAGLQVQPFTYWTLTGEYARTSDGADSSYAIRLAWCK